MTDNRNNNNKIRRKTVSSNRNSPVDLNKRRLTTNYNGEEHFRRGENRRYPNDRDYNMDEDDFDLLPSQRKYNVRNSGEYSSVRKSSGGRKSNVVSFDRKSARDDKSRRRDEYPQRRDEYSQIRDSYSYDDEDYDDEDYYDDDDSLIKDYRKKQRKKQKRLRILKRIVTVLLIILVIGGSAGFIYVKSITNDMPEVTKKMVMDSYINKDPVPLSKIPKTLQEAVIAVEDNRFYQHGGIDVRSLARSFFNNLINSQIQGGSTIDMQLSKNLLTNNQRTLKRKIQDIYNSIEINKVMTKKEILEAYLNNIYMGKGAYGVEAGAKLYFGKNVWDLDFGECTMLAGITNNPSIYSDYEMAKKRQAVVLKLMYKKGYITEEQYKSQKFKDTPFKSEIDK